MANLLVSLDIDALWKLWVFVSITSFVIIDVSRILYDCVNGEYAATRRKLKKEEAHEKWFRERWSL